MIAAIVAAIIVLVAGATWAASLMRSRSPRKSVKNYEHALEVLGSAANRSGVKASVQVPSDEQIGHSHVRPEATDAFAVRSAPGTSPAPLARIEPPDVLARSPDVLPIGTDGTGARRAPAPGIADPREGPSIAGAGPAAALIGRHRSSTSVEPSEGTAVVPVVVFDDSAPPPEVFDDVARAAPLGLSRRSRPPKLPRDRLSSGRWRAAAAVGVVAVLVGVGLYVAVDRSPTAKSTAPKTTSVPGRPRPARRTVPTAPRPSALLPLSITSSRVAYVEPSGNYTVTFRANGPMWLGFEHQANPNGPWLATPTLGTGGLATYTFSTNGPLVVVVGAPRQLAGVAVNGKALVVPPGRVAAFDLVFEPAPGTQH